MLKACLKLLITGIILFIVGFIGLATLAVNGYDISDLSLPVRYGGSENYAVTSTYIVDNGEYSYDGENFSILDIKYADTVKNLDINVKAGNFTVLQGETLGISGYNISTEYLDYRVENSTLYVTYSPQLYLFNFDIDEAQIVISVPPKVFEDAKFTVKAGGIDVHDFKANKLYAEFSAGESVFSNVSASELASLKMTAGECVLEGCSFNNSDIKMTAGSMVYSACKIIGENKINMTAGDLYMELLGKRSDYKFSVHRTAGGVYIDGDYWGNKSEKTAITTEIITETPDSTEVLQSERVEERGENSFDINITAGECNISFYENE